MKPDTSASIWQGKLVRLRALEPSDWEIFWTWNQDDEQARGLYHICFPDSKEREMRSTEKRALREQVDDNWGFVIENSAREVVGAIDSHHCNRRVGHFQYGIAIGPEYRHKGYA